MRVNRFASFSWGLLFYNLLVILWGAYVRASGSGAGCGAHWPLCNGVVIPAPERIATLIEFTHRVMSGLTLLFAVGLVVWAWKAYPRKDRVRKAAALVFLFTLTEALVGAGLVLFQLVEKNASMVRAISVAVHLTNTLLLLGAVTLTAWWASGGTGLNLRNQGALSLWIGLALGLVMILSASGAITALGDTLFPATSLTQGMSEDFSPTAHFLIRLRIFHPVIAAITGLSVVGLAVWVSFRKRSTLIRQLSRGLIALFVFQICLGILNVYLLAPIWMQILHLLTSDLVWICLVLMTLASLGQPGVPEPAAVISRAFPERANR